MLFVVASIVYQFPLLYDLLYRPFFNWAPGIDTASTSLLPLSLLERGDWTLNSFTDFARQNYRDPYFLAVVNNRVVSRFPVVGAVLAMPFYGVPLASGWIEDSGYPWLPYPWTAFMVAKSAAGWMTALAVVMLFLCVCELSDLRTGLALAGIFGFATSVWSTASLGLWQQTPSILLQTIGIWFILRGRRKGAMAIAPGAIFFSAATVARQNNAIPALVFTIYVLIKYRPAFLRWVLWAIPPVLLAISYNTVYNGSPLVFGYQEGLQQTMGLPRPEGILGLLLSPSRGLLIYSPFFLFAFSSLRHLNAEKDRQFYWCAALVFAAGVLLLSTFQGWDGGWGYGTRLLVDVLPYAVLLLIPSFVRTSGAVRGAFWAMAAYAVLLQGFGLWDYGVRWHWHWPDWKYSVWDVAENEPLFYAKEYAAMGRHFIEKYLVR